MEVEHYSDQRDLEGPQGPCIACLNEEELDSDGLCTGCNPLDEETRVALINLLKTPTTNEVKTSENN